MGIQEQESAAVPGTVTPSAYLRRRGTRLRTFGVILVVLSVLGSLGLALDATPRTVENFVLMGVEIAFGLLLFADGAIVLAAAQLFPDVARQQRLLSRTGLAAVIFSTVASGALFLVSVVDSARRPALFDAALLPLGFLVVYLLVRSSLRDALTFGRPGARVVTPAEYLRQSAKALAGTGAFLVIFGGALWAHYALHGHTLTKSERLFLVLLLVFAILIAAQGAIAVRAAPRFPAVEGLARTNLLVGFTAMVIGVGGTVTLVTLGAGESPILVIVPVAVTILIAYNAWLLRVFLTVLAAQVRSQGEIPVP